MERGSSSQRSWAEEVEEEELAGGSLNLAAGLNPDVAPFFGSASPAGLGPVGLNPDVPAFHGGSSPAGSWFDYGGRLSFSDSEDSYGSEPCSPSSEGKGKAVAVEGRRRRRLHRRCRARNPEGFMAAAAAATHRWRASRRPLAPTKSPPSGALPPWLLIRCAPLVRQMLTDFTKSRVVVIGAGARHPSNRSRCRSTLSASASIAWGRTMSRKTTSSDRGASTAGVNAIAGGTAPSPLGRGGGWETLSLPGQDGQSSSCCALVKDRASAAAGRLRPNGLHPVCLHGLLNVCAPLLRPAYPGGFP
jgi:hypothetical protein